MNETATKRLHIGIALANVVLALASIWFAYQTHCYAEQAKAFSRQTQQTLQRQRQAGPNDTSTLK